jgi:short chain dehydrogenase
MFRRAQEQMGPLTALVNNAGAAAEQAHVDEQREDALTRLMQVNVVGPMLCAKHAVRAMSTAHGGKGGSIVTIAGILAKAPPGDWGMVPHETTKGAMVTFARPVERGRIRGHPVQQLLAWGHRDSNGDSGPSGHGIAEPAGQDRPARRDRRNRVVADLAQRVVRHRQRCPRHRRGVGEIGS